MKHKYITLFLLLLCPILICAQQTLKLGNDLINLEWKKGKTGWQLKTFEAKQQNGFSPFGITSGEYSLLYSKEKPSEAPVPIIENGDTLQFPEKTFKYVYTKFQRAISSVPMNKAGERYNFFPTDAKETSGGITFSRQTEYGNYLAHWELCKEFPTDILINLSFTAAKEGFYSLQTPTLSTLSEDKLQWGIVPGFFQGNSIQHSFPLSYVYAQGLPAYPVLCRESTLTTMASIISNKNGVTMAVIPQPGQDRNPYTQDHNTHNTLWNIALSHMNENSKLTPTAYHPVLGENGSFLRKGESIHFTYRVTLSNTDWYSAYKHAIYDIYQFDKSLELKDTKLSLTDRLFMLYNYVLDKKTAKWNFETYRGDTIAAQSYLSGVTGADGDAMKNSDIGAVWMLSHITGDSLLNKAILPYIRNFKIHQQVADGFFKGAAEGQYFLAKKKIFTEEWGQHVEPVGITYYTLMDIGNILLFEPGNEKLKTLLKNGADRLLEWQQPDGSWVIGYDKQTHKPIYTDIQDLRPTFYGLLIAYQLLGDDNYLKAAEKGAQWIIRNGVNKGHFTGVCGDVRFVNDFSTIQCAQALLDLYEVTANTNYLDAAIQTAKLYTSSIYTHPVPTGEVKTRGGKQWTDWQLSQAGLCFEHGGSMGSAVDHGPILLLSHCGMFLRMYQQTQDSLFLDMARAGALARDAFVNPETGVASYYWSRFDQGAGNFPHHAWWQIGWIYDYLVSEAELRSGGRVAFPRGFMTPKVGPHKSLGFKPGTIDGKEVNLILKEGLITLDNTNVDYITALSTDEQTLYVILLNNQKRKNRVTVSIKGVPMNRAIELSPFGIEIIPLPAFTGESPQSRLHYLHYYKRIEKFNAERPVNSDDIVLLGNSLTESNDWNKALGEEIRNRGISGDTSAGVYDRLYQILPGKPRKIFLMIGINDISRGVSVDSLLHNINLIIEKVQKESPQSKFYLQSMLPVNESVGEYSNLKGKNAMIADINQRLKRLAEEKKVTYVDVAKHFIDDNNQLRLELTRDGLHLKKEGYKLWEDVLRNTGTNYFSTAYIQSIINKTAEWQLAHPRHGQNEWTNGVFYSGLFAAWETTRSQKLYDALMAMGNDSTGWKPAKRYYHADDIVISQTFIDLYNIEKKEEMIRPTIDALNLFIERPYPVKGWEIIKYWWCDALFMGPPTFVKLGNATGNTDYFRYNDIYFKECYDLLYNREERLFARALNYVIKGDAEDKYEANGKRIFWSRGNGWVVAGLVKMLKELPADYSQRPFYEQLLKEMLERIVALQPADGLWRTSLLDPESYPHGEVSGSSLFCYALAWAVNNNLLDAQTYRPVIEKTWTALNNCIHEDGRIGWVQPIGANPQKNFSADSWEVYGTGAFLLAASEVIKLRHPERTILLTGASFATPANGWFEMGCERLNAVPLNKAVAGESIIHTANKMKEGTLYTTEELKKMTALVIMHVHNRNVADDSDYGIAYDYVIKKYTSDCHALGKPAIIVLCTHWHDARTTFNKTIRQLAERWGLPLVEFDKNIGFSKNELHPVTGKQYSLMYASDVQTTDGVVYGFHPLKGRDEYIQQRMAAIFAARLREVLL